MSLSLSISHHGSTLETALYLCDRGTHGKWKNWVTRFLNHVSEMMTPPPREVVWCYGEWQAGHSQLKGVTFVEILPKVEEWDTTKRRLVILDDLIVQELCESRGGRAGLSVLTSLLVSVDVKIY